MIPFQNFSTYRPGQSEVIERVVESEAKFVIVSAPTGVGKSLIGMMSSHNYQPSTYMVSTKILQEQLVDDYPESVVMMGRNNYPCPRFANFDLQADSCVKRGCRFISSCPYESQKSEALQAKYRVLNLHYFLYAVNFAGNFSGQELVILDEADHIEKILVDFISLTLGKGARNYLQAHDLGNPERFTKPETWKPWAERCYKTAGSEARELEKYLKSTSAPNQEAVRKFKSVSNLANKMQILHDYSDDTWIRYELGSNIHYKPIWLTPELADRFLFRHARKFLFLSATFPEFSTYCRLIGIPQADSEYIELPSPFPVENRKVYYEPVADMSYKAYEINKLTNEIIRILDLHPDVKGIIHATSYKLRDHIMAMLHPRLITHESGDKEQVLQEFMQSEEPLVLVSPSIERGVSLNDDLARFCIIPKVPYQSTKDRVVSSRLHSGYKGQEWYRADASQRIVQMAGRVVRSSTDHADTWILDSNFTRLVQKPRYFPEWFRDSIVF